MNDVPVVRQAVAGDAGAIAAFTTDTFSWGDYVGDAFPAWLAEPDTAVAVATDPADQPIAVARVRMLSPKEGWLSAARVHPEHRRRGLGSALNHWAVGWVAERGGLVTRLQIEDSNEPARRQVLGLGYRLAARVLNGERSIGGDGLEPATNGGKRVTGPERLDRAPTAESELAYVAWSTSDLARASRGMVAVDLWAWRRMTKDDASSARVWHCPSGWVIAEHEERKLVVRWLVCTPDDADRLLKAVVDLAHEHHVERLEVVAPRLDWMESALSLNGLETHPTEIYEKTI